MDNKDLKEYYENKYQNTVVIFQDDEKGIRVVGYVEVDEDESNNQMRIILQTRWGCDVISKTLEWTSKKISSLTEGIMLPDDIVYRRFGLKGIKQWQKNVDYVKNILAKIAEYIKKYNKEEKE